MKKNNFKKLNRNTNNPIFGNRASPTNIITSDIFEDHLWLPNEGNTTTGVQIVELRSSDSAKSSDDDKDYFPIPNNQQWNYSKQNMEEYYKINKAAREERRQREQNNANNNASEYHDDDFVFADFFFSGSCDRQNENAVYNQMNCFTILNKHLKNSESSDEDFGDVEEINCDDNSQEWPFEGRNFNGDIIKHEPNHESEKRTVWIYSFKNKHLLSENDYELVNIPSQEGSSQSSVDNFQQDSLENDVRRVSSPVPPFYVPRLYLPSTPPLPTVTELTEPGGQSSANQTEEAIPSKKIGFRENNWFRSEPVTGKVEVVDKSTSVVNWMALSPREKRRRFRNASPINLPTDLLDCVPTLNEVRSQIEKIETGKVMEMLTKDVDNECRCQCGDNVKFSRDESTMTDEILQSSRSRVSALERMGSSILDSAKKSVRTIKSNLASNREYQSKSSIEHTPKDRGDLPRRLKPRPHIKITQETNTRNIAGPMENIESDNWIYEEKLIKDDDVHRPLDAKGDRASHSLWVRSMALLKPADWTEYETTFEVQSIPSLHLSMNTESVEENQTFFRRMSKFFNCCKLCH